MINSCHLFNTWFISLSHLVEAEWSTSPPPPSFDLQQQFYLTNVNGEICDCYCNQFIFWFWWTKSFFKALKSLCWNCACVSCIIMRLLCIPLLFLVLFHLRWRPSPARVKTFCAFRLRLLVSRTCQSCTLLHLNEVSSAAWGAAMKQGFGVGLSNVENWGIGEDKGDSSSRRREKKKKHKNPSHKPFKPHQSLQRSQTGQEPARNVKDGAEHWTKIFCFLIWNDF